MTHALSHPCTKTERHHHRWSLVLAERERLLRLATSRLGHTTDAEDCVQEAMIRAVTFEALDESRVAALLTTITLRLCVDHQRGTQRDRRLAHRVQILRRSEPDTGSEVEHRVCERAAGAWLLTQVTGLGNRERDVLLARARGMSTSETANALEITYKSAESAFTRARSRLRVLYHEEMAR
ncbi:sigma-70 family RNA polymerase sigma factor [Streptomyces sp. M2CJ-2]|uniref:RNA polymerase sigma factor n=1 Tax=Streptomyces sp. M2CJ-2 TaxID=2803948 RepID=UPI0027DD1521|nr:sigma-70 family RNA polymerase sigma factor [Streptomyces sp. M2CJ-2]